MKKTILILTLVFLISSVFTTLCFATEGGSENEAETVFSRIWEYIDTYSEQILSYAVDIIVLLVIGFTTKGGKKMTSKLIGTISKCASEDTQTNVVDALNSIIKELNTEHAENAELKKMIEVLKTDLSNVHKETRGIFDAMLSVWGNSKNLPQGIKDILTLTYSSCLKSEEASTEVIKNDEGEVN